MSAIELRGIQKTYGQIHVLRDLNLDIQAGTFTIVFGMPICGKSVLVRLITGLEKPTAGRIHLRGRDMTDTDSGSRNIGYVPQSFALYPHYSVYDNIAYPLQLIKASRQETDEAVGRIAGMAGIESLREHRLYLKVDNPVWKMEMNFQLEEIKKRVNSCLGWNQVREVILL